MHVHKYLGETGIYVHAYRRYWFSNQFSNKKVNVVGRMWYPEMPQMLGKGVGTYIDMHTKDV